ncbi:helix-turn-helix domain-containing protein [Flavobacterium aestuarii]|uniref:helix-turn-helix domain-containing protein n=1 Tax=Flavobacterium aestuarii TaxID=3149227 RepID=UPI0032B3CA74
MINQSAFTLVNPQNGNLAFKLFSFESNACFDHIQRLNYYSLIWVQKGKGKVKVDFSEYDFTENQLLAFAPYQPFMLSPDDLFEGKVIHFHPDFFCIMKHHDEVACNGVLFNNIYEPPYVMVNEMAGATFNMVLEQMKIEMQNPAMAQYELLISYLKIFLITASRLKKEQQAVATSVVDEKSTPFVLQNLRNFIEQNFKTKHSASDYAELLNISPKALAKITKNHFNKTLTNLIAERIIIEAKRELYLTNKAVKEIAYELGYEDEHYFSRFFKTNAEVSPQTYRDTVGFARAVN